MKKVILRNPVKVVRQEEVFTARGSEPKYKTVEFEGKDIVDYVVEEAKFDAEGNIIERNKPPFYEPSGRSLKWTIKVGEELAFPEYVAKVLKNRYDWLEIGPDTEKLEPTKEMEVKPINDIKTSVPKEGSLTCKYCGKIFANSRALGLHVGIMHPSELI